MDRELEQHIPEVVFDEAMEDELFGEGFESLSDEPPSEDNAIKLSNSMKNKTIMGIFYISL